jgi:hypothetical protein
VAVGNIMRYPEVTSLVITGGSLITEWRGQGEANRLSKLLPFSGFKVPRYKHNDSSKSWYPSKQRKKYLQNRKNNFTFKMNE